MVSKKCKKACRHFNCVEHSLISVVTGCVSISAFASLVGIPIGINSSAAGSKTCAITAGIKKYTSIIKKRWKKHDKTVSLGKAKSNAIEVLIWNFNWHEY